VTADEVDISSVCVFFFLPRWRTLLSVDDMVEDILDTLDSNGILDNTYIFFSSDNGYHLGTYLFHQTMAII
jgi:N-acetylglucosamine-6-sulfatase